MTRGNITTTLQNNQRVTFSCPPISDCIDDLDALQVAIRHARSQLIEQQTEDTHAAFLDSDLHADFKLQPSRMPTLGKPLLSRRLTVNKDA